jgi:hypothetical protein
LIYSQSYSDPLPRSAKLRPPSDLFRFARVTLVVPSIYAEIKDEEDEVYYHV